ncbi:diaminopimelate decarboxylase [Geomesophilobacter sediminis]|uniref:Diaminopimelate decarboxylase n=1 Tax=Geomesophilobacter sediminis TaxID=2798584 RepID=A0A8J7J0S3_9BACT|nr:diaminopimelate decarboxylase [Geomesophilobacter sediminis]MBJ6724048.1 diaminopimelate decarboxylase [Geomesophilobacter sediminis]
MGRTPCYLYDGSIIHRKCQEVLAMPNAFGIEPRYAMKANSNATILREIVKHGFGIDASSLNEARRARLAGIDPPKIMLTTQEVPVGSDRVALEELMRLGMKYNVCSVRQLELVADFAVANGTRLCIRVHPGVGSGESASRNTGDHYSCFGVHLSDLPQALEFAKTKGIIFDAVHVHIGSGGDPAKWRENIDRELGFVREYFPDAERVSFGGGLKEARMPDEVAADLKELGNYAKQRIQEFYEETGRKLIMEVEPGTYIVANSGYIITEIIDLKRTGPEGFEFLVLNGGMELNTRPLLYGSRHPLYVVAQNGELLSAEGELGHLHPEDDLRVVVGRCCESGDSQSLDSDGNIIPRLLAEPAFGDFVVIGGAGAYCASMSPHNYNSHIQVAEVLMGEDGNLHLIRKPQTLEQIVQNEILLDSTKAYQEKPFGERSLRDQASAY